MATEKEIEAIKARINIYDIVSSYVKLKRSGTNYFGLCPFHSEKTPSFSVNDELGIFKCFGCQESGDVITFVEKIESISFKDAIEKLATMAGIQLSGTFSTEHSARKRILEMNALAAEVFSYLLIKHAAGKQARDYLTHRNISQDSILTFGLGFDTYDTLVRIFKKRGYTDKEIITYGFGVLRQGVLVDKYRNRVIFPIYSITGDVIGFSGRIIEKNDHAPKYINSPETEVFKKNGILYGLYQTKKDIKEKDNIILLEGPIDVISSYQNDVRNICAVQGTSLTPNHLRILKRLTQNISFCFDQDQAGMRALRRSFFISAEAEMNVKVITIHDAKDVDERVNNDKQGFQEDMHTPLDLIEFFINKDISEANTAILEGKLSVINDIIPLISQIKEDVKISFYLTKLAEAVQVDIGEIRKIMLTKNTQHKQEVVRNIEKRIQSENSRTEYLLALFLQHYQEIKQIILKFDESILTDLSIKAIIIKLKIFSQEGKTIKEAIALLEEKQKELCQNLISINLKKLKQDSEYNIETEINEITKILTKKKIMLEIDELKNKLWVHEQEHNEEEINHLLKEISDLTQKLTLISL